MTSQDPWGNGSYEDDLSSSKPTPSKGNASTSLVSYSKVFNDAGAYGGVTFTNSTTFDFGESNPDLTIVVVTHPSTDQLANTTFHAQTVVQRADLTHSLNANLAIANTRRVAKKKVEKEERESKRKAEEREYILEQAKRISAPTTKVCTFSSKLPFVSSNTWKGCLKARYNKKHTWFSRMRNVFVLAA